MNEFILKTIIEELIQLDDDLIFTEDELNESLNEYLTIQCD